MEFVVKYELVYNLATFTLLPPEYAWRSSYRSADNIDIYSYYIPPSSTNFKMYFRIYSQVLERSILNVLLMKFKKPLRTLRAFAFYKSLIIRQTLDKPFLQAISN